MESEQRNETESDEHEMHTRTTNSFVLNEMDKSTTTTTFDHRPNVKSIMTQASSPINQIKSLQEFKGNYGTATTPTSPLSTHSSAVYCLHGKCSIEKGRGHCHKPRLEGVDVKARKKLIIASVLCVFFMIAEIVGGVLSNSLAIATDAAHLLTDFASFMISLFAIWIAGRPSTQRMSFGWYRAEVIGAMASVFMIWVITGILVYLAIERVVKKDFEVNAEIMLITSGLAIVVNLIMGAQLHGAHGHSHGGGGGGGGGHGHSHKFSSKTTKSSVEDFNGSVAVDVVHNAQLDHYHTEEEKGKSHGQHNHPEDDDEPVNLNVRAAFIHVVGDVIQSVGVFAAALLIYFRPEWAIADPICTFIFSIIVLFTTFAITKDALLVLMEGTPSSLHYSEVMEIFQEIDGVVRVHNLRIWALSVNKIALSVHLVIRPGADPKKILEAANAAVHVKYNFFETTIQIEDLTPDMDNCQQCIIPES